MSYATAPAGALRSWLATAPILIILVLVVLQGTGVMLHGRLLAAGESMYPGYSELRSDPEPPTCDPDAIREQAAAQTPDESDEFLDDLFAEEDPPDAPVGGDDFLDDLFEDSGASAPSGPSQEAIEAAVAQCLTTHEEYEDRLSRITPGVQRFRSVERSVANLVRWGDAHTRHTLVLLILICSIVATWLRAHIALRPIKSVRDDRVSQLIQLTANLGLLASSWVKYRVDQGSGLEIQNASLPVLWMAGFGLMAAVNIRHLIKPVAGTEPGRGLARPLLTVPLYVIMALSAMAHFFAFEQHPAGPAIYLQKLTENAKLYIQVGLYVWTGMLLKRTRIAHLCFDLLRPWKLPPELLAPIVVAAAAIPTAYSGASGIFVIAAGAVIYDELRKAGARRQLAIAATAMSGSLGVVLSPCLLVVVVAALNYEVTTTELYTWGWKVYAVSATLFLIACILSRREKFTIAPPREAFVGSLRALGPLVPYALISVGVLYFYSLALGTELNEHTAPVILPIMLLLLLVYDRWSTRRGHRRAQATSPDAAQEPSERPAGSFRSAVRSTDEATAHCGALLMLMGLSMGVGGVIERSNLMAIVPESFGSVWIATGVLVLVLVFIGMIMDPYGAVILVSVTIAPIAYNSGLDPLHFWLVVLCAFELGYLTPPVALNQLLTRQVIPDEVDPDADESTFWRRHESVLLPLVVMAVRLVLVALVPLGFY